ncbi:MAG: hypothetical protein HUJ29_00975 [Gammaproteobacteria bacterium]|nr:hypothetical protein [Gammaproteobacteria bacterium]
MQANVMRPVVWILALSLLSGCATFSEQFSAVERQLLQGKPEQALSTLEKAPGADRDRVLYLLNRSMLLRMTDQFEASNESLEQAKEIMKKLAATSVSETTGSLTINDATRSYVGEPFEQVMVHLIKALNYLEMGQRDSARVEVLQMDVRLRELYQKERSAYMEDPFGRYLAGMIYEELGEYSDAMVSYRKSFEAYERQLKDFGVAAPQGLKLALVRMSQRMGLNNEHKDYKQGFNIQQFQSVAQRRREGRLVFILGNGLAPKKLERTLSLRDYRYNQLHRVALPYYSKRSQRQLLGGLRLEAAGEAVEADLAEDINAIARQTLEEQMPGIKTRALARAVAKSAMVSSSRRNNDDNPWVGLIVNIATVATERADTRSWVTLPSEFYIADLGLDPGRYDINVQFIGRHGGAVDAMVLKDVEITAGRNNYHFYHWVSPASRKRN